MPNTRDHASGYVMIRYIVTVPRGTYRLRWMRPAPCKPARRREMPLAGETSAAPYT